MSEFGNTVSIILAVYRPLKTDSPKSVIITLQDHITN